MRDELPRGRAKVLDASLKEERKRAKRIGADKTKEEKDKLRLCKLCRNADPVPTGHIAEGHCNGNVPSCDCQCTVEVDDGLG